jgi:hypothetical protein
VLSDLELKKNFNNKINYYCCYYYLSCPHYLINLFKDLSFVKQIQDEIFLQKNSVKNKQVKKQIEKYCLLGQKLELKEPDLKKDKNNLTVKKQKIIIGLVESLFAE